MGFPCFTLSIGEGSVEPNLFTGFLSAIASFAREVSKDAVLKTVSIPPLKIVAQQVMEQPQVIVSLVALESFPLRIAEVVLQEVTKVFLDNYSQDLVNLRGIDLTPELSPKVHEAIVSSLKLLLDDLSKKRTSKGKSPGKS